ncbi:hypothetical protein JMJ77_0000479, partial [Colletotrichum scovillei]
LTAWINTISPSDLQLAHKKTGHSRFYIRLAPNKRCNSQLSPLPFPSLQETRTRCIDAPVSSDHRAKASLRWKIIRAAGTSASQASIMRRRVDCKLVEWIL